MPSAPICNEVTYPTAWYSTSLLGRPARSFEEFAADYATAFS